MVLLLQQMVAMQDIMVLDMGMGQMILATVPMWGVILPAAWQLDQLVMAIHMLLVDTTETLIGSLVNLTAPQPLEQEPVLDMLVGWVLDLVQMVQGMVWQEGRHNVVLMRGLGHILLLVNA